MNNAALRLYNTPGFRQFPGASFKSTERSPANVFTSKQIAKYAEVLLWGLSTSRTTPLARHDNVLVQFDLTAVRLAEVLFAKLMDQGLNVIARLTSTASMEVSFYQKSDEGQLTFVPPGTRELFQNLHGAMYILAPQSLTHLCRVDSQRIARHTLSRKSFRDILVQREEAGIFGWTLCIYPTREYAKCAGLTRQDFTGQIIKACFLDAPDPVAEWTRIHAQAMEIKNRLNSLKVQSFRVESDNVDLVVTPGEKRRWMGISGHNIPSFELFLSPDWRGTQGVYYADQPSYRCGNLVKGVRLEFDKGEVVAVSAEQGEEFVKKQVAMDSGSNKLGEFSLTDKRFSNIDRFMANTLFDENYGGEHGNCHVALGSSYSDTFDGDPATLNEDMKSNLGFNDSALHWDLVNTESKRVSAKMSDGSSVTIYDDGFFIF